MKTRLARAINTSQFGIVSQVSALGISELTKLLAREKRGELLEKVEPLRAVVMWDDGSHTITNFRHLSIVENEEVETKT